MISWIKQQSAGAADFAMCTMMGAFQWRLRGHICTKDEFDAYIRYSEPLTREQYFACEDMDAIEQHGETISWRSPILSNYEENDRARALLFFAPKKWKAPTMIVLHALMSASDLGYRQWAKKFNKQGWNVVFLHLPFHYSRTPKKHMNGELIITANLIRFVESIRQAVMEVVQVMRYFRAKGCGEFGLWGTSFGGWVGALVLALEKDFRFAGLMQPIVNPVHAIWGSPTSRMLRRQLRPLGITAEDVAKHTHLTSPLHAPLACEADRVTIFGGNFDTISPVTELKKLHAYWKGSHLKLIPQGHFGYAVMNEAYRVCEPLLKTA